MAMQRVKGVSPIQTMSSGALRSTGQSRDLEGVGRVLSSEEEGAGETRGVSDQDEKQALMGDKVASSAGKAKISGVHHQTLVAGACFCLASGGMVRVFLCSCGMY